MTEETYAEFDKWLKWNPTDLYANPEDFAEAAFEAGVEFAIEKAREAITRVWGVL